jgi:hypothetical protein
LTTTLVLTPPSLKLPATASDRVIVNFVIEQKAP